MKRILLQGGRIIDPASGLDAVGDVAVVGNRIESVGAGLPSDDAEVIDCRSKLVLPGLIDTHAHVYEHVTGSFGLNADLCGVRSATPMRRKR
jgi:dihydroorotase